MTPLRLQCACGGVTGTLSAAPGEGVRARCYCDDCQAYARWLGRDDTTDGFGGTEVVQTWPARVEFRGEISLLRLSPKGLFRWYAPCCRRALANTLGSPRLAFIGVMAACVVAEDQPELVPRFGPATGVQGRFAPGGVPEGTVASATIPVLWRAASLLARGAWAGAASPNPVRRNPPIPALILYHEERSALYR